VKSLSYRFVLEELQSCLSPDRLRVRAMFGSHGLYVDEKIVFMLRRKDDPATVRDNGLWVAMLPEHTASVARQFPTLRPIELFQGQAFSGWLNLPEDEDGFEEAAFELCKLVAKGDPRLGKVPKPKKPRARH
jgi:hypothetical protein